MLFTFDTINSAIALFVHWSTHDLERICGLLCSFRWLTHFLLGSLDCLQRGLYFGYIITNWECIPGVSAFKQLGIYFNLHHFSLTQILCLFRELVEICVRKECSPFI